MSPASARLIISTLVGLAMATSTLRLFAVHQAEFHHIDVGRFTSTLECESGFQWDAIGDKGTSYGVAQFHAPETDWGFTKESALDPFFAIAKAAEAFENGQASRWSCYKIILAKLSPHDT